MDKKRQHYVPRSYLQAWCDPLTPTGQKPFVWIFPKDGNTPKRKAPENIFVETEFYTIHTKNGERDLTIEDNLSKLEGEFATLRRNKIDRRIASFSMKEHLVLCMFTVAMHARTKSYAQHWSGQWHQVVEMGERMQRVMEEVSPAQRKQLASAMSDGPGGEESFTLDQAREMMENPIQNSISELVVSMSPMLHKMPFVIAEATGREIFVTSDNPCVWFDPEGNGGLSSPTIEISLPLSPKHLLFFGHLLIAKGIYLPVDDNFVAQQNKRVGHYAQSHFVSSRG